MLESDYPYVAHNQTCTYNPDLGKVTVTAVNLVPGQSVDQLKAAIAQGPTSVTVDASQPIFGQYKNGVINSPACGTDLDHAITAVGYGVTSSGNTEYYIVRNSWGDGWGNKGYVNIAAKDGPGICGIQYISAWPNTN